MDYVRIEILKNNKKILYKKYSNTLLFTHIIFYSCQILPLIIISPLYVTSP